MGVKMIMLIFILELYLLNCVMCGRLPKKSLKSKEESGIGKKLKTIQYFGDLYDCLEFSKQPVFDDPLLQNHTFQYQYHRDFVKKSHLWRSNSGVGLPEGGCPMGTVPIQRTKLKDHEYARNSLSYRAVVGTANFGGDKYFGARTNMSVYGPKVSPRQESFALMALGNGPERIEVGWRVNPTLSNDPRPRLYVYTEAKSKSCYDLSCRQFVQVNPSIPIGLVFNYVSIPGVDLEEITLKIHRLDLFGQTWYLSYGPDELIVGYWPREVFSDMADFATYAEWGGKARGTFGGKGPQMGTGYFPNGRLENAYHINPQTINADSKLHDPEHTVAISDNVQFYKAVDYGPVGNIERLVEFGGPGPI